MYTSKEGQPVPGAIFRTRKNDSWVNLSSDDIFSGRSVIVFGLPGAYTPTCSSAHLPRYEELFEAFKQQGIDDIYCLSVNDAFVMNSWAQGQDAKHVKMLPDGNGEFTEKMGLVFDARELGFGKRTWRYSMLVRDGIIEKQFIEPVEAGDPFKVSDADTMLHYLAPEAKPQASVSVFSKPGCPFCARAKQMLHDNRMAFEEIVLGSDATSTSLRAITGVSTVPQVYIGGQHIGGSDDLENWFARR